MNVKQILAALNSDTPAIDAFKLLCEELKEVAERDARNFLDMPESHIHPSMPRYVGELVTTYWKYSLGGANEPPHIDKAASRAADLQIKATRLNRAGKNRNSAGHVYLIRDETGLYKIGKSTDVQRRIKQLQLMSPTKLELVVCVFVEDMTDLERHLHEMFEAQSSHGEWFSLESKHIDIIKSVMRTWEPEGDGNLA